MLASSDIPGRGVTPSAAATTWTASSSSSRPRARTATRRRGSRRGARAAICSASRVLPTPPGPVMVTSGLVAERVGDVDDRLVAADERRDLRAGGCRGNESSEAGGAKSSGEPGPDELEDALGGERGRGGGARRGRRSPRPSVERVAGELFGRERDEDLTTVRRGHQPRGTVHRGAVVVAVAELGVAGVHAHPHPQRPGLAPRFRRRSPAVPAAAAQCIVRAAEDRVHAVARGLHDAARRAPGSRRAGARRGGRGRLASRRGSPPRDASNPRDR